MLGMAFLNATLIPLLCRKAGESSSARPYASIVFGAEAKVAFASRAIVLPSCSAALPGYSRD
jgi:hypothetical protein